MYIYIYIYIYMSMQPLSAKIPSYGDAIVSVQDTKSCSKLHAFNCINN